MEEYKIRSIVAGWYERAGQENDKITKFVFLWFCFNAWLAYESEEDRDFDMLAWLTLSRGESSKLRRAFNAAKQADGFRDCLQTLVGLAPVASPGRRQRGAACIKSPDNFADIAWGIYRVRCNLFHGGKNVDSRRDQELVEVCAQVLEKWVGFLVEGWQQEGNLD